MIGTETADSVPYSLLEMGCADEAGSVTKITSMRKAVKAMIDCWNIVFFAQVKNSRWVYILFIWRFNYRTVRREFTATLGV